jgi:hypothetical protein
MYDKECTQALEKAMEKLEGVKENVKAFIVLAVTDEESLDGNANTGVNAVCGKGDDVINLLANLPNELILSTAIGLTRKALLSFEKEENDDKKVH